MALKPNQIAALGCDLDPMLVYERPDSGMSYLQGWEVIKMLNLAFGHDGWGYSVEREQVFTWANEQKNGRREAEVLSVVRLHVAGKPDIVDTGGGTGFGMTAVQDAAKEGTTDGLKRCAKSLGLPFGLALYEKPAKDGSRRYVRAGAFREFRDALEGVASEPAVSDTLAPAQFAEVLYNAPAADFVAKEGAGYLRKVGPSLNPGQTAQLKALLRGRKNLADSARGGPDGKREDDGMSPKQTADLATAKAIVNTYAADFG